MNLRLMVIFPHLVPILPLSKSHHPSYLYRGKKMIVTLVSGQSRNLFDQTWNEESKRCYLNTSDKTLPQILTPSLSKCIQLIPPYLMLCYLSSNVLWWSLLSFMSFSQVSILVCIAPGVSDYNFGSYMYLQTEGD